MTLGLAERQGDLLDEVNRFCEQSLSQGSVYRLLNLERDRLFPDEMFADLFSDRGRRSVPPCVVATVMVLQRLEGLSDREAVERYAFDARWRYAAGVGGYDGGGWARFAHTVLVDMRARLAASHDPRRIFRVCLQAASAAGLVGAKRVLDSTPLYDAVATMDTITLIDLRARDGYACLAVLEGRDLGPELAEAAVLLATVLGQDLEVTDDGTFRIARRVGKDRIISTVDPQARHGHKSSACGFDGYKGHVALDPASEIITDTEVSAGNVGDAAVATELIDDLLSAPGADQSQDTDDEAAEGSTVYGDSAYGSGEFQDTLANNDIASRCKTQQPTAPAGRFAKDRFEVDLGTDTVTCPAG